jgi:hypothetical protein
MSPDPAMVGRRQGGTNVEVELCGRDWVLLRKVSGMAVVASVPPRGEGGSDTGPVRGEGEDSAMVGCFDGVELLSFMLRAACRYVLASKLPRPSPVSAVLLSL